MFVAFKQMVAVFPWTGFGRVAATLGGHGDHDHDFVRALAVLEGGRLASGSQKDDFVKVWELATGACVATLEGHQSAVTSLAVLEHGRLASGSFDGTIKVCWAANKRFKDLKFKFKFPITRTFELSSNPENPENLEKIIHNIWGMW